MKKNISVILGIPIDNLSMDETITKIFSFIDEYPETKNPRQVATVNVDFVVNTLKYSLSKIRHPELLEILNQSDLVIADGMPVVWASRLMGIELVSRVAGSDLVPLIAKEASKRAKSVYFLGGRGDIGKRAAMILKEQYPNLIIAGYDAPFVHIDSEKILHSIEDDKGIIETINSSGADILLIGFGNPKQEIWFHRNKDKLKVPVSIGIGGTFEFIAGTVSRAPVWMQTTGLEWIYRIIQDPKRLWKRYLIGFFKFGLMIWPQILFFRYQKLRPGLTQHSELPSINHLDDNITLEIKFSNILNDNACAFIREDLTNAIKEKDRIILDLRNINHMDSSGFSCLYDILRQCKQMKKELYITGLSKAVKKALTITRTLPIFKNYLVENVNDLYKRPPSKNTPSFNYSIESNGDETHLQLNGMLEASEMATLDMAKIYTKLTGKHCICNLGGLKFVDSSGLVFFLKINKHLTEHNQTMSLSNIPENVMQMFNITKLNKIFQINN